jgi:putative spermidine/putrescine transport system ATP-binding protein
MMRAGASIAFRDVRRSFGTVKAVDGVSIAIEPGEFFTLLGPSGSGKTSLLHLLAGFQQPDSGEIELDGQSLAGLPPFRRGIGVVFQSYALFPHLSVSENVAFPLRVRRLKRAQIAEQVQGALDMVHLGEYGERKVSQLSGGQQQRVALARAFVFEPRLLLMDEPLSALDAKLRRSMRSEIKSIQRKLGVTVLYVTHDQDEALAMSDRIAVMNNGKVEQLDAPAGLYERPASRFVAEFIGESNLVDAVVESAATDNIVDLRSGPHRLRALAPSRLPPGAQVAISIRPERIILNPPGTVFNRLTGRVVSVSYGGDHSLVKIDIGNGLILTAKRAAEDGVAPSIGGDVAIGWEPERGIALPA